MNFDQFFEQASEAQARVLKLQEETNRLVPPEKLLDQAFEELLNYTAELQATQEELHQQAEELTVTHEVVEQERQRYHDLFEFAPDGYVVTDIYGKIEEANQAAHSLFNVSRSVKGSLLILFVFHEDRYLFRQHLIRLIQQGLTAKTLELRLQPRNYTAPIFASVRIGIVRNKQGAVSGLRWLLRDVTEQKRLENELRAERAQLKQLSQRLVEVQEAERRSIACELHDELGQSLTGLKYMLEESGTEGAADRAGASLEMVKGLIENVRNLSLNLRPTMLDDMGLLPTLIWHFDRFTEQTRIKVRFTHQGLGKRFGPQLETAVYRIVQEALTNVARYAQVQEVSVSINADERYLRLHIEDQGVGFDLNGINRGTSNGLTGIRERVLLSGGHLNLQSMVGLGTTLLIELPVECINSETAS